MPILKDSLKQVGLANVVTYINSGNIIFETNLKSQLEITKLCEKVILDNFNLNIPVMIIPVDDLSTALNNAPSWWDVDENSKHNAIFVIQPHTPESIIKELPTTNPEYELVSCFGQVIFWSAPTKTFSKTKWSKISSTNVYNNITIRNANTTKKLVTLKG